jgi:hypothetical protein
MVRTSGVSRGWNGNHTPVSDVDPDREEPDREEPSVLRASEVISLLGTQEPPRPEEKTAPEDGGERGDSA